MKPDMPVPGRNWSFSNSVRFACAAMPLCVFGLSNPILAQSQTSVSARTVLVDEESIVKVEDLNFGQIFGAAAGTVVMTATTAPTCTASAGLVHSGDCQPAEFIGKGVLGQIVRIKGPNANRIDLTGPGANMRINNLVIDGGTDMAFQSGTGAFKRYLITNSTGFFTFRLAGRLNVGANQAPGVYTGTFDVQYNYD
jgi:spore coat protein U-like protein